VEGQLVEPFLIGRGIGVSPVALLVSAMQWAWLWGLPGLLLATPLAACLKVAGDYMPDLGFLTILLGANSGSDNYHDYFRLLLELDESGARTLAIGYCDTHGLEATFDDVLIPALNLAAGAERGSYQSRKSKIHRHHGAWLKIRQPVCKGADDAAASDLGRMCAGRYPRPGSADAPRASSPFRSGSYLDR